MPRKPAHEQFDTLQTIRDRAFELFGRYGYEGVSIGDIAKAAKLSKGALYWHYRGKEELYLDCLKRLHDLFNQCIFTPMAAEPDPVRAVLTLFLGLEQLSRHPRVENGVAGFWLIPSSSETGRLIEAQRAFESASQDIITAALKLGVERGQFDLGNDLDDMARAIISLVEATVLPLRHLSPDETHRNLGVLARTLFRAYARGDALAQIARGL